MSMYTVSHSIIDTLTEYRVKYCFGIPGDAIDSIIDAIRTQEVIEFIQVRHEESGSLASSAYGKLTGELSVCMGTSGPGAIHLLNGAYDAKMDRAPMLLITWNPATHLLGTDYFQEIDHIKLFDDVTVFNQMAVSADQFPRLIADACKAALVHQWVAHINIPIDISMQKIKNTPITPRWAWRKTIAAAKDISHASQIINAATKPMIMIGRWSRFAEKEIAALAEKIQAPIIHALPAKDIAVGHPHKCGGSGLLGTPAWDVAMQGTDCLIMIGTSFPYSAFYPQNKISSVQIDLHPEQINKRYPVDIWLVGHADQTLWALLPQLTAKEDSTFLSKVQKSRTSRSEDESKKETSLASPLKPQRLAYEAWEKADDNAIFVVDTGAVTVWWARNLKLRWTQKFTVSANLWTMAYSMSGALGAALAYPDRQIIALSGDGSMGMLMGDFVTAVKHKLNINVIVFNNGKLGLIQMEQEVHGMPEYMTALANPDYAQFAQCCGGSWYTVNTPDELDAVLTQAFADPLPSIINVHIDPEELTRPPHITLKQAMWFAEAKAKEIMGAGDKDGWLEVIKEIIDQQLG